MKTPATRISSYKCSARGNQPRVFIEGRFLSAAGFKPKENFVVIYRKGYVIVRLQKDGDRTVHFKGERPVVDINASGLRESLGQVSRVQVKITNEMIVIRATRAERKRLNRCRNNREGSAFSGGGLLTKAAELVGFRPGFAIEKERKYAEIFASNFPRAKIFNQEAHEVDFSELRPVELFTLGIPCAPFAESWTTVLGGREKRDRTIPREAHPLSAALMYTATLIHHLNPSTILIEEGPRFLESGAGWMMRHFLEKLDYKVESCVIKPVEFGELSNRRRSVIVAHSLENFDWEEIKAAALAEARPMKLADILEPDELVKDLWFDRTTKPWIFDTWESQRKRGNGFFARPLSPESQIIPTIKRGYLGYNHPDAPVLRHPTKPDTFRWLSLTEVRRLHGVPDDFIVGDEKSRRLAGEVIGQGVLVRLFKHIIAYATGRAGRVAAAQQLAFGY